MPAHPQPAAKASSVPWVRDSTRGEPSCVRTAERTRGVVATRRNGQRPDCLASRTLEVEAVDLQQSGARIGTRRPTMSQQQHKAQLVCAGCKSQRQHETRPLHLSGPSANALVPHNQQIQLATASESGATDLHAQALQAAVPVQLQFEPDGALRQALCVICRCGRQLEIVEECRVGAAIRRQRRGEIHVWTGHGDNLESFGHALFSRNSGERI